MLRIKKIRPLNTQVITTAHKYIDAEKNANGLIVDMKKLAGSMKEFQKVVAVGNLVKTVEVGETVFVNPKRYMKKQYDNSLREDMNANPTISVNIPTIMLDGVEHLMLDIQDIAYVIEEYEETPSAVIKTAEPKLILPKAKTLKV